MRKKTQFGKSMAFSLIAAACLMTSCRSTDSENNLSEKNTISGVSFNFSPEEFDNTPINTQATLNRKITAVSDVNKSELSSGPFSILTELSFAPLSQKNITAQASSKLVFLADQLGNSANPVKYRIVAYKAADGSYVDQAVGDSSNANQIFFQNKLQAGQKYTFVIYSLGGITDPGAAPTTNLNTSVLPISGLDGSPSGSDLMYGIQKDVTILFGNVATPLTAPLKHMFTKLTIKVFTGEESVYNNVIKKGGYPLDSDNKGGTTGTISNFYNSVNLKLNGGTVTGGSKGTLTVTGISSSPKEVIVNTEANSSYANKIDFAPGAIEIGNDINPSAIAIDINGIGGYGLKNGYRYNLDLTFNSDRYVDTNNNTVTSSSPLARYVVIGGLRWNRINDGAVFPTTNVASIDDYSTNPEGLIGNYHQWGRKDIIVYPNGTYSGGVYNQTYVNSNYTSVDQPNPWSNGKPIAPEKQPADPCRSSDERLPTQIEANKLVRITNTVVESNVRQLASKRNSDVKITFPSAGYYNNAGNLLRKGDGSIILWEGAVFRHTANGLDYNIMYNIGDPNGSFNNPVSQFSMAVIHLTEQPNTQLYSFQIRCIQNKIDGNFNPIN
ncbi:MULTISPECIES: hypothetical protein [Elizabethkingia]|uniref:Uncharacterized protein n=1 Tax=Elizabethkingia ursingii TaxID=1756150 RepID=A0AAJ3NEQ5_9FLAO|nr:MULTISPECIES: hypothetical protein [Elizabethkingia]AQW92922.1 hypothetical protein BBD30_01305 [Elizabethkingia anophelis]AQX09788.1 hypothetical protein BBD34_14565 [Elizabethkingia ursingii]OPB61466.1 hypothetical protein BAS07_16955 [Elizabethkingia anophelis]OPB78676.1 hypothetical protein BAY32_00625 [Elizabethkingia ursingii]OPB92835.1 hypothetical protein BB021_00070 [Elizabethkingia ursingii]